MFTLTRNTNIWHKYRCNFVYPITWKYYVHIYRTGEKRKTHMHQKELLLRSIVQHYYGSGSVFYFLLKISIPSAIWMQDNNQTMDPFSPDDFCHLRTWVLAFRVTWLARWWLPELVQSLSIQYLRITTSWGISWLHLRVQSREHLLVSINARFHWLVWPVIMLNSWPCLPLWKLEMT